MFIPIGGIFVFGGCNTRSCVINRIIMGIINLIMGAVALAFGYTQGLVFLQIIGWIIAGTALLMIIVNLFNLKGAPKNESSYFTEVE